MSRRGSWQPGLYPPCLAWPSHPDQEPQMTPAETDFQELCVGRRVSRQGLPGEGGTPALCVVPGQEWTSPMGRWAQGSSQTHLSVPRLGRTLGTLGMDRGVWGHLDAAGVLRGSGFPQGPEGAEQAWHQYRRVPGALSVSPLHVGPLIHILRSQCQTWAGHGELMQGPSWLIHPQP